MTVVLVAVVTYKCHKAKSKYGFKNHSMWARELPQQLFQRDPGLIPSTHMLAHSHLLTPVLGDLMPSGFWWHQAYMWYIEIPAGKHPYT